MMRSWPPGGATLISGAPLTNPPRLHASRPVHPSSRIGHVGCRHGGAQLPGQDVAREVIEHGGQIEPAPADDLQIREVGLEGSSIKNRSSVSKDPDGFDAKI